MSNISKKNNQNKGEKIYLFVPYHHNNIVKNLGGKFDLEIKKWYIENDNKELLTLVNKYGKETDKIYLNFPFSYNNIAKNNGAKWDQQKRSWYVYFEEDKNII